VSSLNLGATNAEFVTIGNANEIGATTIDGGSGITLNALAGPISESGGAITIAGTAASSLTTNSGTLTLGAGGSTGGNGVVVTTQANSTSAFSVQGAAGGTTLLNVDTTDNEISLGTGAGSAVGYSGIGTSSGGGSGNDLISAQRLTTTAAGTVTSMSAYVGVWGIQASPDNLYQYAIYADNGSGTAPGAYIASSAIGTLGTTAAWYTLPIHATLSASTTYWLVYWQNGNIGSDNGYSYTAGISGALSVSGGSDTWQSGPDNGMPAAFPTVAASGQNLASVYASYSSSGPALTINQYGALTQDGASLFQDPTDSTQALQVEDSLGDVLFTADTADMVIDVAGSNSDFATLTLANAHFGSTQATPPSIASPTNCGSGATAAVTSGSTDSAGSYTITTGTGAPTTCNTAITFHSPYATTPKSITLTAGSQNAANLNGYVNDSAITSTGFATGTGSSPATSTTYTWNYWVVQ